MRVWTPGKAELMAQEAAQKFRLAFALGFVSALVLVFAWEALTR